MAKIAKERRGAMRAAKELNKKRLEAQERAKREKALRDAALWQAYATQRAKESGAGQQSARP